MSESTEPRTFDICKLDVKEGDIVVLRYPIKLPQNIREEIERDFSKRFPDIRFMVLHGGIEAAVLSKEQVTEAHNELENRDGRSR